MTIKQDLINARFKFEAEIKGLLHEEYPNLLFYISPDNEISVWLRGRNDSCGAGINLDKKNSKLSMFDNRYFDFLNKQVALAVQKPDEYFYCTECGRVLKNEDYAANVFAGYYCKECAEKPEIDNLIKQSQERGFYD